MITALNRTSPLATRSPTCLDVTPDPIATISPTGSCPKVRGNCVGILPLVMCTLV
nr:hypothetical protein [Chlorogloea sp. CCALA 695]